MASLDVPLALRMVCGSKDVLDSEMLVHCSDYLVHEFLSSVRSDDSGETRDIKEDSFYQESGPVLSGIAFEGLNPAEP